MQNAFRKFGLIVLVLTFAILPSLSPSLSASAGNENCPYESFGCREPFIDCCCQRGVICASSHAQCESYCNGGW